MSNKSPKIKPLGKLVLVKTKENSETEIEGFIHPSTTEEGLLKRAIVVAIGDSDEIKVKVGDTVVIPRNLRNEIKIDGVKHNILHNDELLAVEQ